MGEGMFLSGHAPAGRAVDGVGLWCRIAVIGAMLAGLSSAARAQSDDFNDGNDAGWTHYDPLAGVGAPGQWTFPGGAYRIRAAVSPAPGTAGPSRAGSLRLDQSYTDFRATVDLATFDNSHDQAIGLFARATQPGLGTTNGYAFTYAVTGGVNLTRVTGEAPTDLGQAPVLLNPAKSYRLVFAGQGPALTGQVFDLSAPTVPLATVSAVDATYAGGSTGLVVFDNTDSRVGSLGADATFDNFSAAPFVAPEPGAAVVFPAGAAVVLLGRGGGRRRRDRRGWPSSDS